MKVRTLLIILITLTLVFYMGSLLLLDTNELLSLTLKEKLLLWNKEDSFAQDTRILSKLAPDQFEHLVIVPGHSVLRVEEISKALKSDKAWYLFPYQMDQGYAEIITSHITRGIDILKWDMKALLIFSGGQTRADIGPGISEAASYYQTAKYHKLFSKNIHYVSKKTSANLRSSDSTAKVEAAAQAEGLLHQGEIADRVFLEEYARDSYENILFSICRFYEVTGKYPKKVTVVGFDFKEKRFMNIHRVVLQFSEHDFRYIGVAPTSKFNSELARKGESIVYNEFLSDVHGCGDQYNAHSVGSVALSELSSLRSLGELYPVPDSVLSTLYIKKMNRNPFKRSLPYIMSNPQLDKFLNFCEWGKPMLLQRNGSISHDQLNFALYANMLRTPWSAKPRTDVLE